MDISQLVYMHHAPLSMFYHLFTHGILPSLFICARAGVVLECYFQLKKEQQDHSKKGITEPFEKSCWYSFTLQDDRGLNKRHQEGMID